MRPLLAVLLSAGALALAPATGLAKGVGQAEVCGSAGCQAVTGNDSGALMAAGSSAGPPSGPAPFYTINIRVPDGPDVVRRFTYDYLPSRGLTHARSQAAGNAWVKLFPRFRAALDDVVRGIEPRPASELLGVPSPASDDGPSWWALAGAALATLVLLALLARYATSVLKARPRASKSAN
jgi:hypothetical protein